MAPFPGGFLHATPADLDWFLPRFGREVFSGGLPSAHQTGKQIVIFARFAQPIIGFVMSV